VFFSPSLKKGSWVGALKGSFHPRVYDGYGLLEVAQATRDDSYYGTRTPVSTRVRCAALTQTDI
jgi:hypothetical protein